jgi:hypothetical protein
VNDDAFVDVHDLRHSSTRLHTGIDARSHKYLVTIAGNIHGCLHRATRVGKGATITGATAIVPRRRHKTFVGDRWPSLCHLQSG